MADARATAVVVEALHAPDDPPARATTVVVEALLAGEAPPARPTAVVVEVLATNVPLSARATAVVVEAMIRRPTPADEVYVTEVGVAAIVENTGDSTGVRASALFAEPLVLVDDYVRASALFAEVLLVPEVSPCDCTTFPVAYRLRIRNAADDDDDLVVTSLITGADALIAEVPNIDGATFDPLTGRTTIGGATVLVIDAAAGAPGIAPDLTDRIVTKLLADVTGRSQLLGRKAFLELSASCEEVDLQPHFAGYVTSLRLVDAITWEIGLAHTSRDDARSKIWARSDDTTISTKSLLMGGPVRLPVPYNTTRSKISENEGFWTAEVIGVYDTFIHLDIDEDNCGAFPPADLAETYNQLRFSDPQMNSPGP